MPRQVAQQAVVSIGGNQTIEITDPVEQKQTAQACTVTMGTPYQLVICDPVRKLPE